VVQEGVAGQEPGGAEGGAGAEAAGNRDAVVPGEGELGRAADLVEGGLDALVDQAGNTVVGAAIGAPGLDGGGTPDIDGEAQAIEAGAEVGGGGRGPDGELHVGSVPHPLPPLRPHG